MTTLTTLAQNPATHAYSTRLDCRHLATLAVFWNSKGERPRSSSELIRLSLEALSTSLITNGEVFFIEDLDQAMETLSRFGCKGTGQSKNIQSLRLTVASITSGTQPDAIVRLNNHRKEGRIDPIEHATALAEFENRLLARTDEDAKNVEEFKDSFKNLP